MTTRRKQHELAAKAAGLAITWKTGHCKGGEFEAAFVDDKPWRPKDSNGDALQLCVKLNMDIGMDFDRIEVFYGQGEVIVEYLYENPPTDKLAATRLAIFRAAIEMGKAMP